MNKLTGIGAFEACWRSLKAMYSINPHESQLLMQSMGRLVDNYASQSEIASELPLPLRKLFNLLVQSYLEGYWIEEEAPTKTISLPTSNETDPVSIATRPLSPARLAAAQRQQRRKIEPTTASEADTCIIHNAI